MVLILLRSEIVRKEWKLNEDFPEAAIQERLDVFRKATLSDIRRDFEETWAQNEFTSAINKLEQLIEDAKSKNQTNW